MNEPNSQYDCHFYSADDMLPRQGSRVSVTPESRDIPAVVKL